MNKKRFNLAITIIFIVLELILYFSFLILDLPSFYLGLSKNISISKNIKFISILICFLFVLLPSNNLNPDEDIPVSLDVHVLRFALLFTLISDYFLLYTSNIIGGLITFIIVQMLYLVRIHRWRVAIRRQTYCKRNVSISNCLIRNIMVSLLVIIIIIFVGFIFTNIRSFPRESILINWTQNRYILIVIGLAVFYFSSLVINFIDSILINRSYRSKQIGVFSIGLGLFILCDINVGLFNMFKYIKTNEFVSNMSGFAMWLFYLPSQVLISLSKYKFGYNKQ